MSLRPRSLGGLLRSRFLILASGEALSRLLTFFAMGYLYRRVGQQEYGILETALGVLAFCTIAVELGFAVLGARSISRGPHDTGRLVSSLVSAQLVMACATLATLVVAALLLPLDTLRRHLLIGFGISLLILPFSLHWVFLGRGEAVPYVVPRTLRWIVYLALVLVLVRSPPDLVWMPWIECGAVLAMSAAYLVAYRRRGDRFQPRLRDGLDGALFLDSLPIGLSNLMWALRFFAPYAIIEAVAGASEVALYAAASRILLVYQGALDVYFTRMFPSFSRAAVATPLALKSLLLRSTGLVLCATIVLTVPIALGSTWVMKTVFGASSEAGPVLTVLFCVAPVLALRRHARVTLVMLNRQRAELVCSVLGVLAHVAILLPAARLQGAGGACWALLAAESFATLLTWGILVRLVWRR